MIKIRAKVLVSQEGKVGGGEKVFRGLLEKGKSAPKKQTLKLARGHRPPKASLAERERGPERV